MNELEHISKKDFVEAATKEGLCYGGSVFDKDIDTVKSLIDKNLDVIGYKLRTQVDTIFFTSGRNMQRKKQDGSISYLSIGGKNCTIYRYRKIYIVHTIMDSEANTSTVMYS